MVTYKVKINDIFIPIDEYGGSINVTYHDTIMIYAEAAKGLKLSTKKVNLVWEKACIMKVNTRIGIENQEQVDERQRAPEKVKRSIPFKDQPNKIHFILSDLVPVNNDCLGSEFIIEFVCETSSNKLNPQVKKKITKEFKFYLIL